MALPLVAGADLTTEKAAQLSVVLLLQHTGGRTRMQPPNRSSWSVLAPCHSGSFDCPATEAGWTSAGLYVAAIYLWQIALLRPHVIHRAASWAGLYVISRSTPPGQLALQLVHLTALVVLFGALGCYGNGGGYEGAGAGGAAEGSFGLARQRRPLTSAHRPQVPIGRGVRTARSPPAGWHASSSFKYT